MKSTRIIYLTSSMPCGSGEEFLIAEVKALIDRGCDVVIVPRSARRGLVNKDAEGLLPITIRNPLWSLDVFAAALGEFLKRPVRCLRAIHGLLSGGSIRALVRNLAVLPKSLWLARLSTEIEAHHIHAQWALTTATMAMVAGRLSGIPWSFTAHRGDIADNNLLETKVRNASFVRFVSKSGLKMAKAICDGAVREQAHVIHMGVQIPRAKNQKSLLPRPDVPVIVCPANLIPVKGHRYLLDAFAILRDRGEQCSLHLAGEGALRKHLERQVSVLHLGSQVRLLGQIPHDKLLDAYREGKVSIVVLPSVDRGNNEHEGIPVSLIEAMSYGIPCVSTATGGIPELLGDESGLLVPPGDSLALADAIETLLQDDRLRIRMATNGYRKACAEFDVEKVVDKLIDLMTVPPGEAIKRA